MENERTFIFVETASLATSAELLAKRPFLSDVRVAKIAFLARTAQSYARAWTTSVRIVQRDATIAAMGWLASMTPFAVGSNKSAALAASGDPKTRMAQLRDARFGLGDGLSAVRTGAFAILRIGAAPFSSGCARRRETGLALGARLAFVGEEVRKGLNDTALGARFCARIFHVSAPPSRGEHAPGRRQTVRGFLCGNFITLGVRWPA